MRIYISGKITGTTDYKEKFQNAAERIAAKGHIPVNPTDMDKVLIDSYTWDEWMQIDLPLLRTSHGVLMLPDWRDSNGARMEHREAIRIHKRMFYEIDDIEEANNE